MLQHLFVAAGILSSMLAATPPAIRLPRITILKGSSASTVDVNLTSERRRLLAVDRAHDVILDLDGIEAERSPAVFFEVYIHAKNAARKRSAGNVALFGQGIRGETRAFRPAHMQLVITDDLREALRRSPVIAITFVAQGASGLPSPPRSASAVVIGRPSIVIAPSTRQ
ncbi:MAG TPA: hypothetical protein VHY33_03210 [Thermoanaerobaculia bacterium]|jgi:hypothetical protein|nr:hypothetical protein [Thermoanaerobaculia bacterium]